MLYATIFHLLAGTVTGSVFKARTLLILLGLVLFEPVILATAHVGLAVPWVVANLIGVQAGYLLGVYVRGVLEHAGYSLPSARPRRML